MDRPDEPFEWGGVPVGGLTECEHLHLVGMGCNEDDYDTDCDECPYNPESSEYIKPKE